MFKRVVRYFLRKLPETRSLMLNRLVDVPQPSTPKATVAFSVLTEAGPTASGKITDDIFLSSFCADLRKKWICNKIRFKRKRDTAIFAK